MQTTTLRNSSVLSRCTGALPAVDENRLSPGCIAVLQKRFHVEREIGHMLTHQLESHASTPCVVHDDCRVGDFLFDEPDSRITAWLDWELASRWHSRRRPGHRARCDRGIPREHPAGKPTMPGRFISFPDLI